jgi:hypothetical protein
MRLLQQKFVHDVIRALWQVYLDPTGPVEMTLTFGPTIPRMTPGHPAHEVQHMATFVLPNTHKVLASVAIKDIAGNPAQVDGPLAWSVSDPSVITLEVSNDGLSAFVIAQGPLGTSQVSVEGDADLGEGVRPITVIGDIEVRASEAVSLEMTFGAAEPKEV